jgi:hypothetical protein
VTLITTKGAGKALEFDGSEVGAAARERLFLASEFCADFSAVGVKFRRRFADRRIG